MAPLQKKKKKKKKKKNVVEKETYSQSVIIYKENLCSEKKFASFLFYLKICQYSHI